MKTIIEHQIERNGSIDYLEKSIIKAKELGAVYFRVNEGFEHSLTKLEFFREMSKEEELQNEIEHAKQHLENLYKKQNEIDNEKI